jgi:hypothetical protein
MRAEPQDCSSEPLIVGPNATSDLPEPKVAKTKTAKAPARNAEIRTSESARIVTTLRKRPTHDPLSEIPKFDVI